MSVEVASCTLAQLFSGNSIISVSKAEIVGELAIPEYQRPYRWTEVQIQRLLQDFTDYQRGEQNFSDGESCPFYLGSIILHQKGSTLNVIDGQQRLTTMALIAYLTEEFQGLSLRYKAPESQQQIKHNLGWLVEKKRQLNKIDFSSIHITLVVTNSEDEAYRFFETQNTGGVRLKGPDIIKAHHLNVIAKNMTNKVRYYAELWESLNDINPIIKLLLRGRYWEYLNLRKDLKDTTRKTMPLHQQERLLVDAVVDEFSPSATGDDVAFGRVTRTYLVNGAQTLMQPQVGYELRQPLNSGANTIRYLEYFQSLRLKYLFKSHDDETLFAFDEFYHDFVCKLDGCAYLKQLFDTSLLLYLSQFGQEQLDIAAKKLFRVVYSRRVSNQVAVKEKSIPAFLKETPMLDWIVKSYTIEQCFYFLDEFKLTVNADGIIDAVKSPTEQKSSTKQNFINKVIEVFNLNVEREATKTEYAQEFADIFSKHITSLGDK
ncbi:DUF262 domain-containing protein (plasmid) [Pseudoalteromonas lipolytica]|uniref:DUF262 domain-containing protein n=1 Tax=Pseudoalteromonas lipolytica TaxID=570156 RepID=UPI003BA008EF